MKMTMTGQWRLLKCVGNGVRVGEKRGHRSVLLDEVGKEVLLLRDRRGRRFRLGKKVGVNEIGKELRYLMAT